MKQKLLLAISTLLGSIIAFILPSCHTQKNATQSDNRPVATLEQNKGIMCLYGVPPEVYRQQQQQDSIVTDTTIVNE